MATDHIVQQGECISSISVQYGFRDYRTIWDHPKNAELKEKRKNPNVLFPGDKVYIPDIEQKEVPCQTGQSHRFQVRMPKLKIRLRLLNLLGKPIANTPCNLQIEGESFSLTTNSDGLIEQEISVNAKQGRLKIEEIEYDIRIGHLDPIDIPSGLHARLNNLGYYVDSIDEVDPELLRFALELFQGNNGLNVTGIADADVIDKVREAYGC